VASDESDGLDWVGGDAEGPVGIVLAGGGARGAYEMGGLSVLLPVLADRRQLPSVIVGTSVGAINGTWLAATMPNLEPEQVVEKGRELWHGLHWERVLASVSSPRSLVPLLRYVGGFFSRKIRVESLFDTSPLLATLKQFYEIEQVEANVLEGRLDAVAVVATRVANGRSVVFHSGGTSVAPDDFRGIDYASGPLRWEHVLASSAFPATFPPVEVGAPSLAKFRGWYVDGGVRLNTPIKPALALGAKRVVVIAPDSLPAKQVAFASDHRPDVFDGGAQIMQALFADPLAHDVRTLGSKNQLAARVPSDAEVVPYILIEPKTSGSIGAIARDVFRSREAEWSQILSSVGAVGRLLHADASRGSGELFSYLFFEPEFTDRLFAAGADDARLWLESRTGRDIWQREPVA
jgi:NTE family protein